MVEIIDGYVIDVDDRNYTLKRDTGSLNKKGEKIYKTYGYYDSLKSALSHCVGFMQRDKLSSDTFTLVDAINAYNKTTERFNHLLELAIKEVEAENESTR